MWYPSHEWAVRVWAAQALNRAFQNQNCIRSWGPHVCTHCPGLTCREQGGWHKLSKLSATSKNTEKALQTVLGAGGTSTVFLWWEFRIVLKEERRETLPWGHTQWPSLSSITERGSEKRIGQIVTILKGTFLFKTLYSVILHMQILCPSLDFGEFSLCLIPGVLKYWVKCGENLCCKMITVLVCLV